MKLNPKLPALFLFFLLVISCKPEGPNIILIMADDMGSECLSMYGGNSYHTPNLEDMAVNGMAVSHCIAQPLCTPSRVKLMTGRSNAVNYTHFGRLDTSWLNIGSLMKEAGYRTCISGKWQLNGLAYKDHFPDWNDNSRPHQMGFDEYCLWQLTRQRSEGERYANPLIEQNGEVLETGPEDYGPDIFSDFVLDFIERNREEAFFIYYPMVLVHEPFVASPDSPTWFNEENRFVSKPEYFSDMMNYTDKIVGKIRHKLEMEGLAENTLLIFTADNGTDRQIVSLTEKRKVNGAKGTTISDGVRVPLIMEWPARFRQKGMQDVLISISDFFATFAELVGREVETEGMSFLPLVSGKDFAGREYASVYYDPRWGSWVNEHRNVFVQDKAYKLYQDGSFFNMQEDVLEKHALKTEDLQEYEQEILKGLSSEMELLPLMK